eukprot:8278080-Pyramimonas_sp.AAC.1
MTRSTVALPQHELSTPIIRIGCGPSSTSRPSYGFDRRTRLMILSAIGVLTSTVAALQLELK